MAQDNPFRHGPASQEEALAEMFELLQEVHKETRLTNGRVGRLEEWRSEMEASRVSKEREISAYERGVKDTLAAPGPLLTNRQKKMLYGLATMLAALPLAQLLVFLRGLL